MGSIGSIIAHHYIKHIGESSKLALPSIITNYSIVHSHMLHLYTIPSLEITNGDFQSSIGFLAIYIYLL